MLLAAVLILYIKYCGTVFIRAVEGPAAHLSSILKQVHSSLELGCCSMCLCFVAFFFSFGRGFFPSHSSQAQSCGVQEPHTGSLEWKAGLHGFSSPFFFSPCYFTWDHCNSSVKEWIPFVFNVYFICYVLHK